MDRELRRAEPGSHRGIFYQRGSGGAAQAECRVAEYTTHWAAQHTAPLTAAVSCHRLFVSSTTIHHHQHQPSVVSGFSKHTLLNICYPQTAPPLYITANKQELDKMQIILTNRINKHPIEYGENILE